MSEIVISPQNCRKQEDNNLNTNHNVGTKWIVTKDTSVNGSYWREVEPFEYDESHFEFVLMPKFQTDALADRDSESVLSDCFFLCLSMKYMTF